jgi:Ca2+-binding EF-hand superfamily protein
MIKTNKLAATVLAAAFAATAAGAVLAQAGQAQAGQPGQANASGERNVGPGEVFSRWDKDKNKVLSIEEFRAGFGEVQQANALRKLHQNFVAMDANKSNALEQNEFANLELIKKAGAKAPMLSAFDSDKNGKLDFKEYVGLIGTMVRNK